MLLRIFTEPQMGATYDDLLAVARRAEESGFDAFFRSDHYLTMSGDGLPGPTDAWVTLAGLARETSRIRLGTLMTAGTFRLPGPLAIAVAQVDQMSGGRVELGLGTGWFDGEHHAYAVPFPPLGERFERLEEQFEILTGLWTTPVGERFSFAGRHYSVTDSPGLPKPAQSPKPPLIVGGAGQKRTPAVAARWADEFNTPFHPFEAAVQQHDRVRKACEAAGRDPGSMVYSAALTTVVGADDAEVQRRSDNIGQAPMQVGLGGTPQQVVDTLGRWAEAGVSRAYLQLLDVDDLDHIRLIGAEVLPEVRGL